MPYNGTLSDLRKSYPVVFGAVLDGTATMRHKKDDDPNGRNTGPVKVRSNQVAGASSAKRGERQDSGEEFDKFYKISYSVNLLAQFAGLREKAGDQSL